MYHPIDEARRDRADADRICVYSRSGAGDPNFGGAMLGLILAEKLLGWRPPWRRAGLREIPARLVLSLSRRAPVGAFNPKSLGAAND